MGMVNSIVFDFHGVILDIATRSVTEEMLKLLKDLKNLDFNLYIFSNTSRDSIEKYDSQYHFLNLFKDVILPSESGYSKPTKEAFDILLEKINIDPSMIALVDDELNNIHQVEMRGMIGIEYTGIDGLRESLASIAGID